MTITLSTSFNLFIAVIAMALLYVWARIGSGIASHFYAGYNPARHGRLWSLFRIAPLSQKLTLILWWPWFVGAVYFARRDER